MSAYAVDIDCADELAHFLPLRLPERADVAIDYLSLSGSWISADERDEGVDTTGEPPVEAPVYHRGERRTLDDYRRWLDAAEAQAPE